MVIEITECDGESTDHKWKTIVEVARALKERKHDYRGCACGGN